jgi:hypothetical protein
MTPILAFGAPLNHRPQMDHDATFAVLKIDNPSSHHHLNRYCQDLGFSLPQLT